MSHSGKRHWTHAAWAILIAPFWLAATALGADDLIARKASDLAAKGKFTAAATLLARLAQDRPAAGHCALGKVYRDAGYFFLDNRLLTRALDEYRMAAAADPEDASALLGQAVLLYEGGKYSEAVAVLDPLVARGGPLAAEAATYLAASRWRISWQESGEKSPKEKHCALCFGPLGGNRTWKLDDERAVCETCFTAGLQEDAALQKIVENVTAILGELGLSGKAVAGCRLVSAAEIRTLAGKNLDSFSGVTPEDLAGLFAPLGTEWRIYILRGLPPFDAIKVVAHELAHSWIREHCPPDISLGNNEGFAEWAAWQVLLKAGQDKAAQRMFLDTGPYGVNFKRMEVLGRIQGPAGLVSRMREDIP